MMEIMKSINVERGWDGIDYRYIRSLYSCPLTFFGFHFILFFLICSLMSYS